MEEIAGYRGDCRLRRRLQAVKEIAGCEGDCRL